MKKRRKYNSENLPDVIAELTDGNEVYVTHAYINVPNKGRRSGIESKLFVVTYNPYKIEFRKPTAMSDLMKYYNKRKVGTKKPKWDDESLTKEIDDLTNEELVYVKGSFYTDEKSQQRVRVTDIFGRNEHETTLGNLRKKYRKDEQL